MSGSLVATLTALVVALLGSGGLAGIYFGRKTVVAQADSVNVATAENVVRLVNAQMEQLRRDHEQERQEYSRRIEALQAQVQVLRDQIRALTQH